MALPGSGMSGFFPRGPGGFLGFGKTPMGAIRPTGSSPTGSMGRSPADAWSQGGTRTPNNTLTRSAPKPTPLTPAQRGAQTRASNRADAAKAAAERQQARDGKFPADAMSQGGSRTPNNTQTRSAPKPTPAQREAQTTASNRDYAAKTAAERQRFAEAFDKRQANQDRAFKAAIGVAGGLGLTAAGLGIYEMVSYNNNTTSPVPDYTKPPPIDVQQYEYDPNTNPPPTVATTSKMTNIDNPSKLAFYLAQAKGKNLTGKDASNYAYTRLKEYKRGGRIRGGL